MFDYGTLKTQLDAGTENFQSAMASMESSFREVSVSAERSFAKISEESKAAAASVSEDWKRAAESTAELNAAKRDLAAAQALVRQTAGEDANALALLAAAEEREAEAAMKAAAAHKVAAAEIGVSTEEIRESLLKTLESAELTGAGMTSVFGGLGAILGVGIAGQMFAEWLNQTGEMIDHLEHLHRATDITREDLQSLQIASQQLGISFDQVQTAIARLSKNAFAAVHNSTGVQAQAFHRLGIETKDLKDLMNDFPELLERVGEGLEKHASGATRVGIAQTLMGRGSTLLSGSLGELAIAAKQAKTELTTMGGVISEKDVAAAHDLDVTTARLSAGWRSLMLPVFQAAVFALKSIESVLIGARGQINAWEQAWVVSAVTMKDSVVPILKLIADVMTGRWAAAAEEAKNVWTRLKDGTAVALQAMEQANKEAADKIGAIWADVQTGPKGKVDLIGDLENPKEKEAAIRQFYQNLINARRALTKELDKEDSEQNKKHRNQIDQELKDEKDKNDAIIKGYKDKKELIDIADKSERDHAASERQITLSNVDFQLQMGLLTQRQAQILRKKALNDEYADKKKEIEAEIALETAGTQAYAKLKAEERRIEDKYRQESLKLDQKEWLEKTQNVRNFLNNIGQNFKTSLAGMLQGTQSFGKMLMSMWQSVAAAALESMLQTETAFKIKHAVMAAISKIFHLGKIKDDAASAASEAATAGTTNTALATSAANLGAANAYAFWAWNPPVAASMAAAALAAGMAFAGASGAAAAAGAGAAAGSGAAGAVGVGFAARGALLDKDQLIFAHAEEMILPPGLSRPLQKALSSPSGSLGGGRTGSVQLVQHVTAFDRTGVDRVMRNNRKVIEKQVRRAMRLGPVKA